MKNRRIAIIAFVLVAVMAIGIGYAATTMSDQFSISGEVTADENNDKFNEYVYFSEVEGVASNGTTVDTTGWIQADAKGSNDIIVVTPPAGSAAFKEVGNKLTVTATVKNDADIAVKLANVDVTGAASDTYFKVTVTGAADNAPITAGGTIDIVIEIELILTPTSLVSNSFTVEFDVVPA